nr:hypothetical protein [uncultured Undibacterium sp.]
MRFCSKIATIFVLILSLSACEKAAESNSNSRSALALLGEPTPISRLQAEASKPILFVTQVPVENDNNTRLSAFANHRTSVKDVPRGGDLMLRYPDGSLRNLTEEAGYGMTGLQADKAIAVREPSVHPDGKKAVFSMLIGSPLKQRELSTQNNFRWQIYEVQGLEKNQKAVIQKIRNQDARFNNISPIYADNDEIIFTSDRPRNGDLHLYPQLDEYEATPSISGLWKLNPITGKLQLLSHTPSGAFNPVIDHFGRVVFTRWDHLQQDQLADRDRDAFRNGVALPFKSFNYADETAKAKQLDSRQEIFPESRVGSESAYGPVHAFRSNFFSIWQIDQDGANEETINHAGLHELSFGYLTPSFMQDKNLSKRTREELHRNQLALRREGGIFHLREDPLEHGVFFGINARESASFTTDSIIKINARPDINPEQMQIIAVTRIDKTDNLKDGRYRNPLPLSDGKLIASHTSNQLPPEPETNLRDLRLKWLQAYPSSQHFTAGTPLTKGIRKSLSWWDGDQLKRFQGELWELDPVEVKTRKRHPTRTPQLESPERSIFQEEQIDEIALRKWLEQHQLALIITRNQTSRDRADLQQPYNLQVPRGTKTISSLNPEGKLYAIQHFQILQAEQIRGYTDRPGRRHIAQAIKDFHPMNLKTASQSKQPTSIDNNENSRSSVVIAKDGSSAAFVPAARALTWQTTDPQGNPVVRERNWISFKAGEIRVCASCHGVNHRDQANFPAPMNKPEALRELLARWKLGK